MPRIDFGTQTYESALDVGASLMLNVELLHIWTSILAVSFGGGKINFFGMEVKRIMREGLESVHLSRVMVGMIIQGSDLG